MTEKKRTRGLVLGKFMPPHNGHAYLIDFARHYVDSLTVYVDSLATQPIPGAVRASWLRQMFPDTTVVHPDIENPQYPNEHPDFWQIWRNSLLSATEGPVDYIFASEEYGLKLAEVIGATFVPVDISRESVQISATKIREDAFANWSYLPQIVRPYFLKRICIFGPESTGKSTLTANLARHYKTIAVPEYARTHLELRNGEISVEDMLPIARGQMANEDALAFQAERLLFCDTDLIATTIWSDWLFGECDAWIESQADERKYDLYLLTDVDVPWIEDKVRYLPEERKSFFERCEKELTKRQRPFHVVSGSWEERFQSATRAVDQLLDR
ncbi:MAG: AAA family ATPase [Planctomycetota bacterium]